MTSDTNDLAAQLRDALELLREAKDGIERSYDFYGAISEPHKKLLKKLTEAGIE